MLDGWHEFYAVLGTAAATLVGLLFVAASIGAGYLSAERRSPTRTFTSPIIFHYTYVLFLSLAALVPINTDHSLAALIGVSAAVALVYSFVILVRVHAQSTVTRSRRPPRLRREPDGGLCRRARRISFHFPAL